MKESVSIATASWTAPTTEHVLVYVWTRSIVAQMCWFENMLRNTEKVFCFMRSPFRKSVARWVSSWVKRGASTNRTALKHEGWLYNQRGMVTVGSFIVRSVPWIVGAFSVVWSADGLLQCIPTTSTMPPRQQRHQVLNSRHLHLMSCQQYISSKPMPSEAVSTPRISSCHTSTKLHHRSLLPKLIFADN